MSSLATQDEMSMDLDSSQKIILKPGLHYNKFFSLLVFAETM